MQNKKSLIMLAMALLLLASTAQAEPTVIFSDSVPTQAIRIENLETGGTVYNVIFSPSETTAAMVYGAFPGTFDFDTAEAAATAADAANAALTDFAARTVGAEGEAPLPLYRVGFASDLFLDRIPTVAFWESATDEEVVAPWVRNPFEDIDHYNLGQRLWAKFTPVSGGPDQVPIGGSVTGLTGSGLVLENNGTDDEPITANPGNDVPFTFDTLVLPGTSYSVTVKTQPSGQLCTVAKGSGTVPAGGVDDVLVTCGDPPLLDEVIGAWSNGIWYYDLATATWTQLSTDTTKGDIAAGDFTGDGIADVAAAFDFGPASNPLGAGVYYLDGASKAWTLIPNSAPPAFNITAGDVTGDGRPEVIGAWSVGIWYYDFVAEDWTQLSTDTTKGDIAAGDFTGDGIADVAAAFDFAPASNPQGAGLYYLDGAFKVWLKVADSAPAPFSVTAGDLTGDGLPEIIATYRDGIWYYNFNFFEAPWTLLSTDTTNKGITAGNFVRNGIADVAAAFDFAPGSNPLGGAGLYYYLIGISGGFSKIPNSAPPAFNFTAGDVTGD